MDFAQYGIFMEMVLWIVKSLHEALPANRHEFDAQKLS